MAFTLQDLGRNVRELRESRPSRLKPGKPLLQYELADLAGIPSSSLCNIERGKYKNPTWEILSKVAAGLECDVSDFFTSGRREVRPEQIALDEMIDLIIKERLEKILEERRIKSGPGQS